MIEPEGGIAQVDDRSGIVGNETERAATTEIAHETHAFLRKGRIPHSERLVDDENIGVDMGDEGKGQAGVHARRIQFDRVLEEMTDIGETGNIGNARFDGVGIQAEQCCAQADILPARELRGQFILVQTDNIRRAPKIGQISLLYLIGGKSHCCFSHKLTNLYKSKLQDRV